MPILTPEERVGSTMAGKYRLDSILATGGMATVFGGVHAWTEREVAVKILNYEHARDPEIVRRFLQEARAAAQLKHANVVDVLDMGQDADGTVYLILERLHGETLKARIKRGTLSLREVGSLLLPVMRAVASAHAKKVVHRDLKPDNIFLATAEGSPVVPKLLDFGIAKVVTSDSGSTRTGMMVGTPSYMAPEQVKGERNVGARADVWSMGVVLHAALTGRVPFEGENSAAVLARVITERARSVLTILPSLRPSVAAVIDRALMFEETARFADMGEMVTALESALDGPSVQPSSPLVDRVATPISRAPLPAPGVVPETPTLQLPDPPLEHDLEQQTQPAATDAAMLPAATPFAWAPTPPTEPALAPPSSRMPWVIGAAAALALAVGGIGYALVSSGEPTARPLTPAAAPVPTAVALPARAVEPPPLAIVDPDAGAPVAAPPTPMATPLPTPAPTPMATPTPAATATPSSTPRPPRAHTPQRGTGGALILH
jgi:serine/threonine protein kinase